MNTNRAVCERKQGLKYRAARQNICLRTPLLPKVACACMFRVCKCEFVCKSVCGWWSPQPSAAWLPAEAGLGLGHRKDERCGVEAGSASGSVGGVRRCSEQQPGSASSTDPPPASEGAPVWQMAVRGWHQPASRSWEKSNWQLQDALRWDKEDSDSHWVSVLLDKQWKVMVTNNYEKMDQNKLSGNEA